MKPTSERIDRRYSDERAEAVPWADAVASNTPDTPPDTPPDTAPDTQVVVFEVTPSKAYGHAKGDPFGQTNYRF